MDNDSFYSFKYIWLNQAEVTHQQSRGLSYEVFGFLPISLGNSPDYLKDLLNGEDNTLLDLGKELYNYKVSDGNTSLTKQITYIFPKVTYTARNNYVIVKDSANYRNYLVDYGGHLFTDIKALHTTEMKFVGTDVDTTYDAQKNTAAAGSIQLSFDVTPETFGTYIDGNFYIDAIMFFGRSYNSRASGDETNQQQLQDIVPIGLLVYMNDRAGTDGTAGRPLVMPGLISDQAYARQSIDISLLQGGFDITAILDDENFEQWKEFAGRFHLANDNLSTSAKFLLVGNDVKKETIADIDNIDALVEEGKTYAIYDRLYMADFGENWDDANDDFASPAMMTCMASAQSGFKNPQAIFAQVSKYVKDNKSINYWDGVAHSYWTDGIDLDDKSIKGSLYSVDWISNKRPGISLFSSDTENVYVDEYHATDKDASASFGGGLQFMSNSSFVSRYASNFLGSNNHLRGDVVTFGSQYIDFYQSGFNASAISESRLNNGSVGSLFLNSEYITVNEPDNGLQLTSIAADNISLHDSTGSTESQRKVSMVNAENYQIYDANRLLLLNTKGKYENGDWLLGTVETTTNTIVANGFNTVRKADKSTIIGDGNYLVGTSSELKVKQCQVLGSDCVLTSVNTKKGQAQKITMIGHGLMYDPKQSIFERSSNACKTMILGQDNNLYSQLGLSNYIGRKGSDVPTFEWTDYANGNIQPTSIKQIVVGGWKPRSVKHKVQRYNVMELSVDNSTVNDANMTIADIKGRSIDYSSRGITVGVQETHSQDSYDYYKYKSLGSINWAKLMQLLYHLEYDVDTGSVKYNMNKGRLNDVANQSNYFDDYDGSRCFYDLVRNDNCVSPLPRNF